MSKKDFGALLQTPPALLGSAGRSGVLIGTLGCLELNLKGHPFPGWSTAETRKAVADALMGVLLKMRRRKWTFVAEMKELSLDERYLLIERGQLTGTMAARQDGVYVLINDAQDTECFINDEEHMLVQSFFPGEEGFKHAQAEMRRMLADFCKKLPVAHDPVFGYLSCDPTKGGEAAFFSTMLHLPGLRLARHMRRIQQAMDDMGVYLTPLSSTSKEDEGDMYLLHSPAATIGKMDTAIQTMKQTVEALHRHELYARAKLLEKGGNATRVAEAIVRAYELLLRSTTLKYKTMLGAISMLRLGLHYELIETKANPDELLSRAFLEAAPAHLVYTRGLVKQRARRKARADYARELLQDKLGARLK